MMLDILLTWISLFSIILTLSSCECVKSDDFNPMSRILSERRYLHVGSLHNVRPCNYSGLLGDGIPESAIWEMGKPQKGYLIGSEYLASGSFRDVVEMYREKAIENVCEPRDNIIESATFLNGVTTTKGNRMLLLTSHYYGGCYNFFVKRLIALQITNNMYTVVFDCYFDHTVDANWYYSADGEILVRTCSYCKNEGAGLYSIGNF